MEQTQKIAAVTRAFEQVAKEYTGQNEPAKARAMREAFKIIEDSPASMVRLYDILTQG